LLSVQDAAAQIAAELLVCEPGARVLDACAAPGGKAIHLLQQYDDINLDLLDISESRLQRVRENLQRVGKTAGLLVGDAASPEDWFTGDHYVMRRHPDIKLLRRESDIMPLLALQRKILDALWRLLKPGGKMLYCTCSIFKEENEIQVAKFLQRHPDCVEVGIDDAAWGEQRPNGRQILTGSANMDGFYYALLRFSVWRRALTATAVILLFLQSAQAQDRDAFVVDSAEFSLEQTLLRLNMVIDSQIPNYILIAIDQGFAVPLMMSTVRSATISTIAKLRCNRLKWFTITPCWISITWRPTRSTTHACALVSIPTSCRCL
jgi:SAM-dependent methyltransferase